VAGGGFLATGDGLIVTGDVLRIGDEVREAIAAGASAVALETSVIGQGLPFPQNQECARRMDDAVRAAGAVPAWIGVMDGSVIVGLTGEQVARVADPDAGATKVARRDYPVAVASGALGATTVSAAIWAAARAGVHVGATGGIGGVHPGPGWDVSADLLELARTPGLLVCSGPKSVVDPVATAERLDELGVAMVGYGVNRLPFFLAREAPVELEHRVDSPREAAAFATAVEDLGGPSALLLCNPVPVEAAMDPGEVRSAVEEAETRARRHGVRGAARTPFLLAALAEITGGRSLVTNLALLEDNARVAGLVATAARSAG
jgi:pseudouridine-5'-phosphate glycosidase